MKTQHKQFLRESLGRIGLQRLTNEQQSNGDHVEEWGDTRGEIAVTVRWIGRDTQQFDTWKFQTAAGKTTQAAQEAGPELLEAWARYVSSLGFKREGTRDHQKRFHAFSAAFVHHG